MEEFPDEQAPPAQVVEDNRPLEVRLSDKNWKTRLEAFKDWGALLAASPTPDGFWDSSNAVIVSMTGDSNNNVLDAGLDIALSYFEAGDSAVVSSIADSVVKNAIDKAFAARSLTQAKGKVLVLKVIETTDPSLCGGALIERLTDKRPKIPPLCLEVLAEGMKSFGSTGFPMKDLLKALPDLFNSSQGPVRDGAMALVLEILRWVGPRPLATLVDNLRPAQKTEYERLAQAIDLTVPAVPTIGLKKDQAKLAAAAAVAASAPTAGKAGVSHFEAVEEEEVDLQKKLKNSSFMDNIRHEKWSEQSQGFQAIIDAIGPSTKLKPYPALTEMMPVMKDLLLNGHINVQGKIVKLVSLLVIGLKSKFAVECRSIFPALIVKSKEKRLSDEVGETCGSAFQCSISMEPWLEEVCELITSKRQPSHGKICLIQSVEMGLSSNRSVAEDGLKAILRSIIACVEESDVQVRQRALLFLKQVTSAFATGNENQRRILQTFEEHFISTIPQLQAKIDAVAEKSAKEATSKPRPAAAALITSAADEIPTRSGGGIPGRESARPTSGAAAANKASSRPTSKGEKKSATSTAAVVESTIDKYSLGFNIKDTFGVIDFETIMTAAVSAESYAAVSALLTDAKWQSKVEALVQIEQVISEMSSVDTSTLTAMYFWIAAATSDLKTTNVNVMKSIVALFANLFKKFTNAFHAAIPCYLLDTFEDKLSDKKISSLVSDLIEQSCLILGTEAAFQRLVANMERVKAPLAHSAFLDYMKDWIGNKGPAGLNVGNIVAFCASEVENKNQAVRTSAINVVVEIYKSIGPQLQLLMNKYPFPPQIRTTIDTECSNAKYDPTKAVAAAVAGVASSKYDLSTVVDRNLMELLNTVQGKDSWQIRKAALEKLIVACDSRSACFELNSFLSETLKAVKLRLSDTQSNLRPLALVALSKVIASLEVEDAQKAMKHYSTTILTGLDESKKNIRDACIAALDLICLRNGQVQVGILNVLSTNCIESIQHSIGKADLLAWLQLHCQMITVESTLLGQALIVALLDKNALVRNHAEEILKVLLEKGLVDTAALVRLVADQAPSNQRALQPIVDRIHLNSPPNVPSTAAAVAVAAPQPRVVPREKAAMAPDVINEVPVAAPAAKTVAVGMPMVPLLESLPSIGPKSARLAEKIPEPSTISKEFIAKFVQDWLGPNVRTDKNVVNSTVFLEKLLLLEIDEKFINQTDMIFRWIGYQFQIIDREHLERLMVLCTQFMDKIRALPRAFKQHLDAAEVVFFIPQLLDKCSMNLSAFEKQHAHSILSCTSDCFPASSVASQLLLGLATGSGDCVHICAQELLRIVESVGIMALGRSGLKQVADLAQSPKYSTSEAFRLFLVGLQECAQLENLSVNFRNLTAPVPVSATSTLVKAEPAAQTQVFQAPAAISRGRAEVNSAPLKLSNQSTAIDVAAVLKRLSTLPVEGANYVVILDLLRSLNERLAAKTEPDVNCHFALGLGCSVWLLKWLRAVADKPSVVSEAMEILNMVFDLRRHITEGHNDTKLVESVNSVLLAVVNASGSIISLHVLVKRFAAAVDEPTVLLHIIRVVSHIAAAKTEKQLDPSTPVWSTIIAGVLSMCEQLANTVGDHHDMDRETLTVISVTLKSIEAVCGVTALRDCVTLAVYFTPTNALSVFWSEESAGMLSDLDGKINALVREITTSSEKLQPIRQLFHLQQANRDLNIEKHLEKLSVTFRRYVLEEFHRLAAMDQPVANQSAEIPRNTSNDSGGSGMHGADEAMRIIESLKTRPSALTPSAEVKTIGGSTPARDGNFPLSLDSVDVEQFASGGGSNLSRRQSKNFGASPFSRRNDKIRDTLANLSKTLELHNFQDSHGANN